MDGRTRIERMVAARERAALRAGVAAEVARTAATATSRALIGADGPDSTLRRRVDAYYGTVVRNLLARSRRPSPALTRMVVESLIADLESAGRAGDDVYAELVRGWGDVLTSEALGDYRTRLCA